ncbi:MAG: Gfo/Idh/MocA family oxidoreductase [Candidatus Sumerlaeia bacterium]|nr:Gfo/Idh/MocA family oxidoreductase [Candidatus Sumerlaeia bacterium]
MKTVEAILIGAGQRGHEAVGAFARRRPRELKFVAVAEPDEGRRNRFGDAHGIPGENRFADWREVVARPRLADLCFNTTMDKAHLESSLSLLDAGYHLFLEKPMADTPSGCLQIAEKAMEKKRLLQVCHPLRYSPFYTKVKELLDGGAIGRILSISMVENVAFWHFAHSYVRGNWRRVEDSGPTILTKCCHDMDAATWLVGEKVRDVSSYGSLRYFREENAPPGAPKRCTDGCPVEESCPYFAPAFYLGTAGFGWPISRGTVEDTQEARLKALKEGDYGRCVYKCDNTAVDNQGVVAEFADGTIFNFALVANSVSCFRTIRVIGTDGELNGKAEEREIRITRFSQGFADEATHQVHNTAILDGAHGGGDTGVISNFLRCYREQDYDGMKASLEIALEGHLLAFAAEQSRTERRSFSMDVYRQSLNH